MPRFRYLAYALDGEELRGAVEAGSPDDAVRRLQREGRFPVEVAEQAVGPLARLLERRRAASSFSPAQLVRLTTDLAALLRAGLTVDRALGVLEAGQRGRPLAASLASVRERLRGGTALSVALAREPSLFPPSFTSVVEAGERAGALPVALERLAAALTRAQRLGETIRSAMIYPTILLAVSFVSVAIVITVIVPEFRPMLEDAHPHEGNLHIATATRLLLALSDLVRDAWWALPIGVLAVAGLLTSLQRQPGAKLVAHKLLLRLPLVGALVRKTDAVRLCETLGTLLGNGVPMTVAIASAAATLRNEVLRARLQAAIAGLREGQGLAGPLERHEVLPSVGIQLIRVGEESGSLHNMLENAAGLFEREVRLIVDRLIKLLVPAIIILLGGFIGALIGIVFTSIMNLNDLAV